MVDVGVERNGIEWEEVEKNEMEKIKRNGIE